MLLSSGAAADAVEAAGWFRRAAEGGVVKAMEWMYAASHTGAPGVPADAAAAYRWAVRGAEAGSAACQVEAGYVLKLGRGVAKDEAAAVRWYRRAADAGHATAQWNMFVSHRDGVGGLRPDDPAAVAWLRAAAEGGFIDAQYELSCLMRDGTGVPADAAGANAWGLRAAEAGHGPSLGDMGRRLLYGHGIPTDAVRGVALLWRGAGVGDLNACMHLGDAHAAGLGGLAVDVGAAQAVFERAAAGGNACVVAAARRRLRDLALSQPNRWVVALPSSVPPVCGHAGCGAALDAGTLSGLCGGCRAVRYCPTGGCQRAAWAGHRPACQAAAARRVAAAAAAAASSSASPGGSSSATLAAQVEETEMWRRMPVDALRQAAEGGTAAAQGALGAAFMHGVLGLGKDVVAGQGWLRKAAAQGQLPARVQLGHAALDEAVVPGADAAALLAEAREWYMP